MTDLQKTYGKRAEAIQRARAVDAELTGLVRNAETFLRNHKFDAHTQRDLIWTGKTFVYQPKGEKKGIVLADAPFAVRSQVAGRIPEFVDSVLTTAERKLGFR